MPQPAPPVWCLTEYARQEELALSLSFDFALSILILSPFAAAALAPLLQRLIGALSGWVLALLPVGIAYALLGFLPRVIAGETVRASLPWAPTFGIELSFLIDGLSLTFAVLIAGIGAAILVYSAAYLRGHPHQDRLFAFLLLFMGSMLGLVLADDLVALYCFWELTTVASFLLVGFDHSRQAARRAAVQALVVTNIGGLGLLVGAVLMRLATGSWELSAVGDLTETALYPAVLAALLLAAFTKSAQVPFHFWLPAAMEAPTPVSAYLHSATMVQAGVYLLFRMSSVLGGSTAWVLTLTLVGGLTLLWGSVAALRQTDLKLILAHTTVASLGLLVLLIGIGSEAALTAAIIYFVAHALYKSTLFLVAGLIDHETGVRDITVLGGLRERMAVTFIAAIFAGLSMIGLPPALGYFAKEEMFLGLMTGAPGYIAIAAVLLLGNAILAAVALAVMIKPFMGPIVPMPKTPQEGPFGMLLAPAALAAAGIVAGWQVGWFALAVAGPAASAAAGRSIDSHLAFSLDPLNPLLWVSLGTWGLAILIYLKRDAARTFSRRLGTALGWSFEHGFDVLVFGLIRFAGAVTRTVNHGRLELYVVVVFALLAAALLVPLWVIGGVPPLPRVADLTFYEWGAVLLAAAGVATVVLAPTRLFAILALGVQGLALALIFMLFGAPDLSFTQFMMEILSVVILALVMTKLRLEIADGRHLEDLLRDGGIAVLCGVGVTMVLLAVLRTPFDSRLSGFYETASVPFGHGRNIVNVILVDFRALDTLGEIAVVLAAGIAILALLRHQSGQPRRVSRRRKSLSAKEPSA